MSSALWLFRYDDVVFSPANGMVFITTESSCDGFIYERVFINIIKYYCTLPYISYNILTYIKYSILTTALFYMLTLLVSCFFM